MPERFQCRFSSLETDASILELFDDSRPRQLIEDSPEGNVAAETLRKLGKTRPVEGRVTVQREDSGIAGGVGEFPFAEPAGDDSGGTLAALSRRCDGPVRGRRLFHSDLGKLSQTKRVVNPVRGRVHLRLGAGYGLKRVADEGILP